MKKLLSGILAFLLCLLACAGCLPTAHAETSRRQQMEYPGEGVIWRSGNNLRSALPQIQLDVAYLTCNKLYLRIGEEATWTAEARGGEGNYQFQFDLYFRAEGDETEFYSWVDGQVYSASRQFSHAITRDGTYFVLLTIDDNAGNSLEYVSQKYISEDAALTAKVQEIANECQAKASGSYGKARFMHDWLLRNASYGKSKYQHDPRGVLLYGVGVCESYALAYQMLLQAVGVSSVMAKGFAGGEGHAWNLVNLNGAWCHVDVTWDDASPAPYAYFGMSDALMRRDHSWTDRNEQAGSNANYLPLRNGYLCFETTQQLEAILDQQIFMQTGRFSIYYTGLDADFDIRKPVFNWFNMQTENRFSGLSTSTPSSGYFMTLTLEYEGVPKPVLLPGDATADGLVDLDDLVMLISHFVLGKPCTSMRNADVDGTGEVNQQDLLLLLSMM